MKTDEEAHFRDRKLDPPIPVSWAVHVRLGSRQIGDNWCDKLPKLVGNPEKKPHVTFLHSDKPGLQFQLWRQPGARARRRRRLCHLSRGRRRHSRKRTGAGTPSSRRVQHLIRHSRWCLLRADSGKPEASQHRLPGTTPWRDPAQPASARLRVGGGCTLP